MMKLHVLKLRADRDVEACRTAATEFASSCTRCDVLRRSQKNTFEKQQAPTGPDVDVVTLLHYGSEFTDRDAASLLSGVAADLTVSSHNLLFPTDLAAFPPHSQSCDPGVENHLDGQVHCYLVFFHIKEESVDDFCKLLLEECAAVRDHEPGMLRYDLYQQSDDLTKFIVYEVARDEEAMRAHEARRADGKLRALLNPMQVVSRKEIAGTGRYEHLFPSALRAQWPSEWRNSSTRKAGRTFPFGFKVSASGEADTKWLSEKFGKQVVAASLRDFEKMGGMSGEFFLLDVTLEQDIGGKKGEEQVALALKSTKNVETAKGLGTPREGLFYAELAPHLAEAGVPNAWYAHGDMTTGDKLVFMECLHDAVPCGVFFGPSNPNNWDMRDKLAEMNKGNPTMREMSAYAFRMYAKMHARYWKDESVLEKRWLRGSDWMLGKGEESWRQSQMLAADAWVEQRALIDKREPPIVWDPHTVACLDKSFSLISWEKFQLYFSATPWTVVHGDCHPHNALWINQRTDAATMKLIDFEMIGVGSPAQELGQYLVSHMPPDERRSCERELVQGYHEEVCANLHQRGLDLEAENFNFEVCWGEYVRGGAGRWLWFVPYLVKVCPPEMAQYFHDQLSAFLHDHIPKVEDIPMPRV